MSPDDQSKRPLLATPSRKKKLRRCASDRADHSLDRAAATPPPPLQSRLLNLAILTAPRAAAVFATYIAVGLLCFIFAHQGFAGKRTVAIVDALYFCAVTMTTVGYGDLIPNTPASKLFTCAFVFVGFAIVGLIIGNAANYFVEKQQRLLEKAFDRESGRPESESRIHFVHHKVAVAAGLVVIVFAAGVAILIFVEGLGFLDAFYCVCVTVTTLGYGDAAFTTMQGRIFAVFWILASTACVAQFMLYLAELVTEERQHALAHWVLSRRVTGFDVEAADIDRDGRLSASEFVIYKLKELGKIQDDDVKEILEDFEQQDADQNGMITLSDVTGQ